jgi:hypothetical protein
MNRAASCRRRLNRGCFRHRARRRTIVLPVVSLLIAPAWNALATDIVGVLPGALDQPQINAIIRPSAGADPYVADDVFEGKGFNITAYLDTGASGILLDGDLADNLQNATTTGLPRQTVNGNPVYFQDVGAVGTDVFGISQPFHLSVAPYHPNIDQKVLDGETQYNSDSSFQNVDLSYYNHSVPNVKAQISANTDPEDPGALAGVNVFGMPTMAGKVAVMDARPLNTLQFDTMRTYLYNPNTPFNAAANDSDPGIPNTTRSIKLSYGTFDSFTKTGTLDNTGTLVPFTGTQLAQNQPTLAHNPFIGPNPLSPAGDTTPPVKLAFGNLTTSGSFLLDTGAGASMISSKLASQLDVRYVPGTQGTTDPQLETYDPAHPTNPGTPIGDQFQLTIGGVGGTTTLAGFYLKSMLVRTTQGNVANDNDPKHIRFLDAPVFINDVKLNDSTALDGIFGMNFLVASALTQNVVFGDQTVSLPVALAPGAFDWITFDETTGLLNLRTRIPGDANRDGKVAFEDLVAVAQNYGSGGTPEDYWAGGDFNGDDIVNFADLVAVAQHYGRSDLFDGEQIDLPYVPFDLGFGQVPEPSSMLLIAGGIAPLLMRRRRQ